MGMTCSTRERGNSSHIHSVALNLQDLTKTRLRPSPPCTEDELVVCSRLVNQLPYSSLPCYLMSLNSGCGRSRARKNSDRPEIWPSRNGLHSNHPLQQPELTASMKKLTAGADHPEFLAIYILS